MKSKINFRLYILCISVLLVIVVSGFKASGEAWAFPFYDLRPGEFVLRAEFSTDYGKSSDERKQNVRLAAKTLNDSFIDVNGEFSFNRTVGARTEKRGYKTAKIIVNGEFTEGLGGGVCQVSTTLYNAAIRAGLIVTEYHAHSLAVSYVSPSTDAMVSYDSADLRIKNPTHNPVLIKASANGTLLTIKIYGEPMTEKYYIKSVIKAEIPPEYSVITDDSGEYSDLYSGEQRVIKYGKAGLISESFLIKKINGQEVEIKRLRRDKYQPVKGVVVKGTKQPPVTDNDNGAPICEEESGAA